jgi:hypothetical protein
MTDLDIDELYADVIASASPTDFIRKTLRDLVAKMKTGDVFVPHDVSLNVVRSDRTALLHVEPDEGWAALLMRTESDDRRREMAFHWSDAGTYRIAPYRIAFSIPEDIGDIAAELERDGWSIVPIIPGWTMRANGVPLDQGRLRRATFKHAVTRCPLPGA